MLYIYGRKRVKIKQYDDYLVGCENCKQLGIRYIVYQEYYHLFFIPIYPSPLKTIKSFCLKCNDYNEKKSNYYLSKSKTPFYFYTGLIFLFSFILLIIFTIITTNRQEKNYVNNPKQGDVYTIKQENYNSATYYFMKVNNVKLDTIELIHNAYSYSTIPAVMDALDYFVKHDYTKILKSDIKKKYEEGIINSVDREYASNSRFNIEK
jgi:hypothetical protein